MYCEKCGSKMSENALFCPKCGEKVKALDENESFQQGSNKEKKCSIKGKHIIAGLMVIVFIVLCYNVGKQFIGYMNKRQYSKKLDNNEIQIPTNTKKENDSKPVKNVTLKVCDLGEELQSNDIVDTSHGESLIESLCNGFNKMDPEYNVKLEFIEFEDSEFSEGKVDVYFLPSVEQASAYVGDYYMVAMDAANYMIEDTGRFSKQFLAEDGGIYALPYSEETRLLYYDTSKFSNTDIKDMDCILKKNITGCEYNLGLALKDKDTFTSFFYSNGCSFFGENTTLEEASLCDFQKPAGVKVAKKMLEIVQSKNLLLCEDKKLITELEDGICAAIISSSNNASQIKKILGEHYGVAKLPTLRLDNKTIQLNAIGNLKSVAVSKACKEQDVAEKFVKWISSEQGKELVYKVTGNPLVNEGQNDDTIRAMNEQWKFTKFMPTIIENMKSNYNTAIKTLLSEMQNGIVTKSNIDKKMDEFVNAVFKDGASSWVGEWNEVNGEQSYITIEKDETMYLIRVYYEYNQYEYTVWNYEGQYDSDTHRIECSGEKYEGNYYDSDEGKEKLSKKDIAAEFYIEDDFLCWDDQNENFGETFIYWQTEKY